MVKNQAKARPVSPVTVGGNGNSRNAAHLGIQGERIPWMRRMNRALGSLVAYCFSWYRY